MGAVNIPIRDVWAALTGGNCSRATEKIVLNIRLIKAIVALLAGAALSVSGLQMQTLFRNPLAGPYVLGISSGASLGVALVVLAGIGSSIGIAGAAWVGAAVVLLVITAVGQRIKDIMVILILGMMFSSGVGAVVQILQYLSKEESLKAFVIWTMGALGDVTSGQLLILVPSVFAGLLLAVLTIKPLNLLLFGEEYAVTMGLNIRRSRSLLFLSTTLLAGTITAFCGPIGFIGLAMPHVTRILFQNSDHHVLLPGTILSDHRYCFFATSFLKYSPCRSTPLQLYWESQSSYGWFYATNPSPHDRITAFFTIGYKENSLLHEVNATIKNGQLTALIGRNGTGKSTLLRAIAGLNRCYSGKNHSRRARHRLHGKPKIWLKTLAVVTTERTRIANLRCKDVVAIGRAPYTNWIGRMQETDKEIVMQSLISVGMEAYANRTMDKMSDGECQRVMIARALAQDTPIILLDEPTSFLDMPNRYELVALLRRLVHDEKKCIMFSTHELDIALSMCDSIALLDTPNLSCLTASEMQKSGYIDRLFQNENIRFDSLCGTMILKQ